jgi:Tfp pilus assembly protein PilX
VRRFHARIRRDERGATLVLAMAFMLVIGGIGAAVISSVTSGLRDRDVLDQVRDRQYAADAGVEYAIAQVRQMPLPGGPGVTDCPGTPPHYNPPAIDGVSIRVDCTNKSGPTMTGLMQRNVIFTACVDTGGPCANPIVRAQVNFEAVSAGSQINVTRTWVQSWSVNR